MQTFWALILAGGLSVTSIAQEKDLDAPPQGIPIKAVPVSRLVFKKQIAYLRSGEKVAAEPFSGIAFVRTPAMSKTVTYSNGLLHGPEYTKGKNWDRFVTYSNGVLHGRELVVVGGRRFYNFNYTNGEIDVTSLEYEPPEKRKPEFYRNQGPGK